MHCIHIHFCSMLSIDLRLLAKRDGESRLLLGSRRRSDDGSKSPRCPTCQQRLKRNMSTSINTTLYTTASRHHAVPVRHSRQA